jgi:hypothetical protein
MADDLEEAARKGQQCKIWPKIYAISGKKKKQSATVRDRSGQPISYPHAQKERWKKQFSELLNPPHRKADILDLEDVTPQPSFEFLTNSSEAPTRSEVVDALKN